MKENTKTKYGFEVSPTLPIHNICILASGANKETPSCPVSCPNHGLSMVNSAALAAKIFYRTSEIPSRETVAKEMGKEDVMAVSSYVTAEISDSCLTPMMNRRVVYSIASEP